MEWTDNALVLGIGRFREADMWVRLLTRQRGMVTAFAFGGSRSRRRFCGCLDLLNLLTVRVQPTRTGAYLSLQEATLLEGLRRLRDDRRRLGMMANCVKFIEALGMAPDGSEAAFVLTRDLLRLFEAEEAPLDIVPTLFRFRLASDQGYAPVMSICAGCGAAVAEMGQAWFFVADGVLACPHCAGTRGGAVALGPKTLDVLRRVQEESPADWMAQTLSLDQRRECAQAVDGFVQYHLGLSWERGRFRRG